MTLPQSARMSPVCQWLWSPAQSRHVQQTGASLCSYHCDTVLVSPSLNILPQNTECRLGRQACRLSDLPTLHHTTAKSIPTSVWDVKERAGGRWMLLEATTGPCLHTASYVRGGWDKIIKATGSMEHNYQYIMYLTRTWNKWKLMSQTVLSPSVCSAMFFVQATFDDIWNTRNTRICIA